MKKKISKAATLFNKKKKTKLSPYKLSLGKGRRSRGRQRSFPVLDPSTIIFKPKIWKRK